MSDKPKYEALFLDGVEHLPFRDPSAIERIVGVVRKAVQLGTGFYDWPLWQRYPTWQQYNQQISDEREAAAKAGRAAHPSVAPPKQRPAPPQGYRNVLDPGKFHPPGWKGPKGSRWPRLTKKKAGV